MKWIILILLLLAALLFLPLSARLRYNSQLAVWAGVGWLRIKVYDSTAPKKEEEPAQEPPPEEKKQPKPDGGKQQKKLDFHQIWTIIQAVPGPLRRLLKRIHIHHTALRILTVGEDAANAAIRAGHTAGAVYSVYGLLSGIFTVDFPEILVLPDFFRQEDQVYFESCVTFRPVALLAFLAGFAVNYFKRTAEKGAGRP